VEHVRCHDNVGSLSAHGTQRVVHGVDAVRTPRYDGRGDAIANAIGRCVGGSSFEHAARDVGEKHADCRGRRDAAQSSGAEQTGDANSTPQLHDRDGSIMTAFAVANELLDAAIQEVAQLPRSGPQHRAALRLELVAAACVARNSELRAAHDHLYCAVGEGVKQRRRGEKVGVEVSVGHHAVAARPLVMEPAPPPPPPTPKSRWTAVWSGLGWKNPVERKVRAGVRPCAAAVGRACADRVRASSALLLAVLRQYGELRKKLQAYEAALTKELKVSQTKLVTLEAEVAHARKQGVSKLKTVYCWGTARCACYPPRPHT
jgi:hypothetical protein